MGAIEDNENLRSERASLLGELGALKKKVNAYNASDVKSAREKNKLDKQQLELGNKLLAINEQLKKGQRAGYAEAQTSLKSMSTMYDKLKKADLQRIDLMMKGGNLQDSYVDEANKLAEINRKISELTADQTIEAAMLQDEYESIWKEFSKLSAISDDVKQNFKEQNKLARDYASISEGVKDQLKAQVEVYDDIKKTLGGILDTFSILTSGPAGFFGTALIGAGKAADYIGANVRDWGGYIGGAQASAMSLGLIFKDASGTAKSLSQEFGGLKDVTFGTQFDTNLMALNMGITGDEAAKTLGNFARLNDGSASMAVDLAESTKELAKQNGLVPADVMKDVAGSSKAFAEFGKKGGKNIAEAAVAAGKLGVNMNALTSVTDKLLDFESSINDELELGAMLGKNLNLNNARSLAYQGEIGSAVKETLNQLGGIDAFNKMDVFQKRKSAELLGLSVEEFQKMATNSDKLNADGTIQQSSWSRIWESVTGIGTGMGGMLKTAGGLVLGLAQMGGSLSQMGLQVPLLSKLFSKIPGVSGGGAAPSPAAAATPPAGAAAPQAENASKFGKINGPQLIQAAAAMLILAAALWVFAKAAQEFGGNIDWGNVFIGIAALALLGGVAALLSLVGPMILVGAGALLIASAAFLVFGIAAQQVAVGMNMLGPALGVFAAGMVAFADAPYIQFGIGMSALAVSMVALGAASPFMMLAGAGLNLVGTALSSLAPTIPMIVEQMSALSQISFMPIFGLAAALMALSVALAAVAFGGLLALPVLGALGGIATLFGGGSGGGKDDHMDELIAEVKGLRDDLNADKVAVYLDGTKVTAGVSRTVATQGTNHYGHK